VARETDFLDLYKILGLHPDCGLIEFKRAYRRRVAVLHPDRRADGHTDTIAAERLQQLTALYSAAMAFHHQHGRLPGTAQVRPARASASRSASCTAVAETPPRGSRRLLLLLGVAVAAWLLWNVEPTQDPVPAAASPATAGQATSRASSGRHDAPVQALRIGMTSDAVRAGEGDPTLTDDDRWEYGPSWILFDNHQVVDWYSSPLRPLKTATQARP
jgi:hypothetical protein